MCPTLPGEHATSPALCCFSHFPSCLLMSVISLTHPAPCCKWKAGKKKGEEKKKEKGGKKNERERERPWPQPGIHPGLLAFTLCMSIGFALSGQPRSRVGMVLPLSEDSLLPFKKIYKEIDPENICVIGVGGFF